MDRVRNRSPRPAYKRRTGAGRALALTAHGTVRPFPATKRLHNHRDHADLRHALIEGSLILLGALPSGPPGGVDVPQAALTQPRICQWLRLPILIPRLWTSKLSTNSPLACATITSTCATRHSQEISTTPPTLRANTPHGASPLLKSRPHCRGKTRRKKNC